MIAVHIVNCGSYLDILFEGEVVTLCLKETFSPSRPILGGLDVALKFVFENAEHYEKEEEVEFIPAEWIGWFDPDVYIDNVREFRKGEEGYDKVFRLMAKACL